MLPRLIGPMNALDLLYSARMVETAEAERLGLVRQLPADNFLARVQAIARELVTASSPRSIGVIKRQVFQSYFQSLAEAWETADIEMTSRLAPRISRKGWRISSRSARPRSPAVSLRAVSNLRRLA